MNIRMTHLARGLCATALLCLAMSAGAGEIPRKFAGMYQITDVIKSGGSVQLTMTFILLNPTNQTVNDGVITVLAATPAAEKIGKFAAIETLPRIGRVRVTETFKISAAEYARWEQGSLPRFELAAPGEEGTTTAGIQARRIQSNIGTGGT
jgi:hypothetical protein